MTRIIRKYVSRLISVLDKWCHTHALASHADVIQTGIITQNTNESPPRAGLLIFRLAVEENKKVKEILHMRECACSHFAWGA